MKNLIQKTLKKIKEEHIVPEPRWKFLVRKLGAWLVLSGIILLGALFVSVIYYLLRQLDWELPRMMHHSVAVYGLSVFPYFWLFWVIILGGVAFMGIRKTESGYRFNWLKIIITISVTVLSLGFFLFSFGWGSHFDRVMRCDIPYYAQHVITKKKQWMQPRKGFLAGRIKSISKSKKEIVLNDLNNQQWEIILSLNTLIAPRVLLKSGKTIKIIGKREKKYKFKATQIRPWLGKNETVNCQ